MILAKVTKRFVSQRRLNVEHIVHAHSEPCSVERIVTVEPILHIPIGLTVVFYDEGVAIWIQTGTGLDEIADITVAGACTKTAIMAPRQADIPLPFRLAVSPDNIAFLRYADVIRNQSEI